MHDDVTFPQGERLPSGRTAWRLSRLEECDALREGREPRAIGPGEDRYLRAKQVARRYNVSEPTVWRWNAQAVRHADGEAA